MRRVVLESPYAGKVEENVLYARRAVSDSLSRGEAPLASHLLYTQPGILKDDVAEQRTKGINAGHTWIPLAEALVVYTDKGVSKGMLEAIAAAKYLRIPIEYRKLDSA